MFKTIKSPGVYLLRSYFGIATSRPEAKDDYFLMHVEGRPPFLKITKVINLFTLRESKWHFFEYNKELYISISNLSGASYSTKCVARIEKGAIIYD